MCCCNWWERTLKAVCLNKEWAIRIWHSWLKHLNCWWKAVITCYSCIFNLQLHVHFKKWTLKFKPLYLRNYAIYFNKIRRISWVNIHIKSLKVWLKSILPWLKYSFFSMGLFFIGAPCRFWDGSWCGGRSLARANKRRNHRVIQCLIDYWPTTTQRSGSFTTPAGANYS